MSQIELRIQDALKGLPSLSSDSVDVVVTSPPYNVGTQYAAYDDRLDRVDYLDWTDRWVGQIARILKPQGAFFLNISGKPTDPWVPYDVAQVVRKHLQLQNVLHWVKSIAIGEDTHGHYKPINSQRFVNDTHEYIFHFTHDGKRLIDREAIGVPYKDPSNLKRWSNATVNRVHCRGSNWHIPYPTRQERKSHPASYPERLVEMCLLLHGLPSREYQEQFQILDPFMGSGTTAMVAAAFGLNCLGFELNKADCIDAAAIIVRKHCCACLVNTPDCEQPSL